MASEFPFQMEDSMNSGPLEKRADTTSTSARP